MQASALLLGAALSKEYGVAFAAATAAVGFVTRPHDRADRVAVALAALTVYAAMRALLVGDAALAATDVGGSSRGALEICEYIGFLGHGENVCYGIGTGFAWTSAALALAHPERLVISIDPLVRPHRERYLSLLDAATRGRLELVEARGQDGPSALGPAEMPPVELLYIDGGHACEATVASFEAWRPALAARAVVAFHDYGDGQWPGVSEAVAQLGLEGEVEGTLFVSTL